MRKQYNLFEMHAGIFTAVMQSKCLLLTKSLQEIFFLNNIR